VLLIGFAVGIWGTIVRPAAYEVRGTLVARPAANLVLVQHDEVPALGMRAMELMAIFGEPAAIDKAGVTPGQRVRLAVRQQNDQLTLVWMEKGG
jgi:Cu/Ag efflux protein CusF